MGYRGQLKAGIELNSFETNGIKRNDDSVIRMDTDSDQAYDEGSDDDEDEVKRVQNGHSMISLSDLGTGIGQ